MAVKGMNGEYGMSPRKSMAMGKSSMGSESFGVTPGLYSSRTTNPDASMNHDALEDGGRAMGKSAKAMADHGPTRIKGR
jgi:hypothetical protein